MNERFPQAATKAPMRLLVVSVGDRLEPLPEFSFSDMPFSDSVIEVVGPVREVNPPMHDDMLYFCRDHHQEGFTVRLSWLLLFWTHASHQLPSEG